MGGNGEAVAVVCRWHSIQGASMISDNPMPALGYPSLGRAFIGFLTSTAALATTMVLLAAL
jgi:hypothetical protein